MKYKYLGKTGIQVSELGFGTLTFGYEADEKTSETLYKRCREVGINHFDCANIYQHGKSEEILGNLIKSERQDVIISSKAYFPTSKDINAKGLSRKHIMNAVDQSLRKMQTDYIDIYYMHRFDENTALEETLRAMSDLVSAGKILYLGVSNFSAWQTMKALGISRTEGFCSVICLQPMYNLIKRQAEVEIFPMALSENIGIMSYNPLAAGLLTGKYSTSSYTKANTQGRLNENKMYQLRYGDPKAQDIANKFIDFCSEHDYSPVSLAIRWAASHPAVTSPLLGARNIEQLNECLKCLEITMTPELRKEITALTPEMAPATDRTDEAQMAHM